MNNTYKNEIEKYEHLGSCGSGYASGDHETLHLAQGSYIAHITLNGIRGKFVVDTGASFVSVTPSFSAKAHLSDISGEIVKASTANGVSEARLVTLDSISLGSLSARKVPGLVMEKSLQKGIDGLLGMSFLSRFKISTEGRLMTISNPEISKSAEIYGQEADTK